MKHKTYSHAKTFLRYHVIFSTKYRRNCLDEIKENVFDCFKYIEKISDFEIIKMNLEKDHIHFLLTWKPALSIEQVIRRMKQLSTYYIWKNNKEYLKQFYWKKSKILWSRGYFISTIGNISEEKILEYIENQS